MIIDAAGVASVGSTQAPSFTNGLAISPDGDYLYVVETSLPGISRLGIAADGSLSSREVVVDMPRTVPDGVAFTDAGRLLISCYRPDTVYLWDGATLETVADDWTGLVLSAPTNVAFGGAELDRLYAANLAANHVTLIDAGLRGTALHYPDIG